MRKIIVAFVLIFSLIFVLASCDQVDTVIKKIKWNKTTNRTQVTNHTNTTVKHTHKYGEWEDANDGTCPEMGKQIRKCSCDESETRYLTENSKHQELLSKIYEAGHTSTYSSLYSIYPEAIAHVEEYGCNLPVLNLLNFMLYGKWTDENGKYLTYTYVYTDYANTKGSSWFGTNLSTSKISGNDYYYYTKVEDGKLVIGYGDKITHEKTDNFVITFGDYKLTLESKIDGKTYELTYDQEYTKVEEGKAKYAYVCIAKKIFTFNYPESVKVIFCYVTTNNETCYATIQYTNSSGVTNNVEFKLYEKNGVYYITEYDHNYTSSNIDVDELNERLQNYVANP